ncbi:MAG: alpha/beta hydrolase [Acidobacteria bacterium]|nr:alpha/beta hydrolase [Acidobacteriota bacterium]
MAAQIRSFFIDGPAGRLEALLNAGGAQPTHAALVCHPHPLFGGTMHNKVVYAAAKALNGLGYPVLRFNFRGAGLSQGRHDQGRSERGDVAAALTWLESEFGLPLIFAGFSFGAAVGLRVACPDARVIALISLGTPVKAEGRAYEYAFLAECRKPKLFVSGDQDPYGPRASLEAVVAAAAAPKQLVWIHGAGHFFEGRVPEVKEHLRVWLSRLMFTRM